MTLSRPGWARGPAAQCALALALGGASALAYAPLALSPLIVVTLAALFRLWRAASVRLSVALGFCFGLGLFGAGVSWVFVSLNTFGNMPAVFAAPATLAFCAYLALYPALAGGLFARLKSGRPGWDTLLAAACWTLAEWLRGWVFTGFPWLAVGYTQTPPSPLAGFAAVVGVYGVGFVVALVAAGFGLGLAHLRAAGLAALIVASGTALTTVSWTRPLERSLEVALIQTNFAQDLKWQATSLPFLLRANRELASAGAARLVVLPETTLPLLTEHLPPGYLDQLAELVRSRGGDLVLGAFERNAAGQIFNSALSMGLSAPQRYAKSHLVPFGEFSPPMFSWVYGALDMPMSDQSRGAANQPPLVIGGERIAINICYEDVFGEEIARSAAAASVLLNLSNLAWYGRSWAQPQHLQIAQMRALETGRPMLRATNTGMTAVIESDGRVTAQLPAFTRGMLNARVRGTEGLTPYVRLGNGPIVSLCGLALLLAWGRRRKGARTLQSTR